MEPTAMEDAELHQINLEMAQALSNAWQARALKAEKRVAELEAALRKVDTTVEKWGFGWDGDCGVAKAVSSIVEAALSGREG